MPIWPVSPYVPRASPGVVGNTPLSTSWSFGSGSLPFWAEDAVASLCMANVGLMRVPRMTRWVRRYFERRDEIERKHANRVNATPRPAQLKGVYWNISTGEVTIRWVDYERRIERQIVMPRTTLVPQTLTVLAVHDC